MKLFLGLFKTTNILPFDVGHFDVGLTEGCRVDAAHGELEMLLCNTHCFQDLGVDFICFDIDDVHLLTDALKSRLCAKSGNVRSDKAVGVFCDSLKINVL